MRIKQLKKRIGILMSAALYASLTACGNSGEEIAGKDWRTTGIIADSGTITHDGASVDVLVTVDPDSAAFYRDLPEQILFDSVSFPETIEDIKTCGFSISFADCNEDGESDVAVTINHEDMTDTFMLWIWDPEERYVYQPELSYFHEPRVLMDPEDGTEWIDLYTGLWEYTEENTWLEIYGDGTWEFISAERDVLSSGSAFASEDEITLYYDGSDETCILSYDSESGNLIDSINGGILTLSDEITSAGNIEEYTGLWEYSGENLWLRIHEDATWEFINDQEDVIESGVLWTEDSGVTLHFEGSGDVLRLERSNSGDLLDNVNGGVLVPVDAAISAAPYFERNGLSINAETDAGTVLLKNGVSTYSGLGDGYAVNDCYWEVIKNSDYTHDGIREIQFNAICYIPESSIPYYSQQYITNTDSELYDYYTGMWLTAASTYQQNTSRGDNHYLHTISRNGQSFLIEFSYSTDWSDSVGDWGKVLTKSYLVYLPEDYDGLIFAAEAQSDNYRDCAKRMQLDSISPEAGAADIELIDPQESLYFSLCH